jgi:hypothetical protein
VCNGNGAKLGFKLDLDFKFFVKMIKIEKLKNPKNRFQNSTKKGRGQDQIFTHCSFVFKVQRIFAAFHLELPMLQNLFNLIKEWGRYGVCLV